MFVFDEVLVKVSRTEVDNLVQDLFILDVTSSMMLNK